jgi:hypothetical protein
MLFQPISRVESSNNQPLLCYVEKFSFAGRRAEDGGRLEEQDIDMYLLQHQFQSWVGDGARMCMGDIIPLMDIMRPVDIVPRYGAQKDPHITANNSLEVPVKFYLNCFLDKDIYHTILNDFL